MQLLHVGSARISCPPPPSKFHICQDKLADEETGRRVKLEETTCDAAHFSAAPEIAAAALLSVVRREAETRTAPGTRHWTSPAGKLDRLRKRGKGERLGEEPKRLVHWRERSGEPWALGMALTRPWALT